MIERFGAAWKDYTDDNLDGLKTNAKKLALYLETAVSIDFWENEDFRTVLNIMVRLLGDSMGKIEEVYQKKYIDNLTYDEKYSRLRTIGYSGKYPFSPEFLDRMLIYWPLIVKFKGSPYGYKLLFELMGADKYNPDSGVYYCKRTSGRNYNLLGGGYINYYYFDNEPESLLYPRGVYFIYGNITLDG